LSEIAFRTAECVFRTIVNGHSGRM
jgi:hypothetical protein